MHGQDEMLERTVKTEPDTTTAYAGDTQRRVEAYWNERPCDSDRSRLEPASRTYFAEIERDRYLHQPHIKRLLEDIDWRARRVLEIGTGVGTDARFMATRGADYVGINVDEGSTALTAASLRAFGLKGRVERCSATALNFPADSFDVVYSFGVLHHIPDVAAAVEEIYRVLRPGGQLIMMVYNRDSINYRLEIVLLRRLFVRALSWPGAIGALCALGFPRDKLERHRELAAAMPRMTAEEWLSRNTDGPDNPYSTVYGRAEVEALLDRFRIERNEVHFFDRRHWGVLGRLLPARAADWLGRRWGWHRVVYARKPGTVTSGGGDAYRVDHQQNQGRTS